MNNKEELAMWRKWRPFLDAYAEWRHQDKPSYPAVPKTSGALWALVENAWEGTCCIPNYRTPSERLQDACKAAVEESDPSNYKAEIDRLRSVLKEIHDAVRKLPDLGALSTAERITWAAAEIAKQREECPIPERVENWISLSDSTIHWKRWLVEILLGAHQLYQVRFTGEGPLGIVARGPCRTVKGGLRLGVAAARRAWRLGVGR